MRYNAHDYQKYAIRFIEEHPQAAVLLDMGLGKTSIALTAAADLLFDCFEVHRVLVIAPVRVAKHTWPSEASLWDHLSHLTWAVAVGTPKQRMEALKSGADITIINRENVQWLIDKSGVPFDWDMVIVDELSSFKNHQAKRFKALMKVRPGVKRIVGLTGTPAANGLMDLWAEYRLLDLGERLGRYITRFRQQYFQPDKTNGAIVYSYKLLPSAEEEIYRRIGDITISMKAADHLKMPQLVSREYPVMMDEKEMKRYRSMKKDLVLSLPEGDITAANAAALTSKLSQMANGAIYGDDGEVMDLHDRKLDAIEDIIESMNGRPLLIAYWFRHDRQRLEERLKEKGIPFEGLEKDDAIGRWNRGEIPVGLLHPMSLGMGVNLQDGGNTIVWYGLTWSLEAYQQTNARLWRQGQKEGTVVVVHLITKGTVDERILKVLEQKDDIQEALIEAVRAEIKERSEGV